MREQLLKKLKDQVIELTVRLKDPCPLCKKPIKTCDVLKCGHVLCINCIYFNEDCLLCEKSNIITG